MKAMIFAVLTFAAVAHASDKVKEVTYTIEDGYGKYVGTGETKWKAAKGAWDQCITTKVEAYEKRYGVTPDMDTVDLYIDACINK